MFFSQDIPLQTAAQHKPICHGWACMIVRTGPEQLVCALSQ